MHRSATRLYRGPRLAWHTQLKLECLRHIIRIEKRLHRAIRWLMPIRRYLIWGSVVTGLAGLLTGMALRLALGL